MKISTTNILLIAFLIMSILFNAVLIMYDKKTTELTAQCDSLVARHNFLVDSANKEFYKKDSIIDYWCNMRSLISEMESTMIKQNKPKIIIVGGQSNE